MTVITVNKKSTIGITVNQRGSVLTSSPVGVVFLKNQSTGSGGGASSVSELSDVTLSEIPPTDGSTLVYDTDTERYIVQQMAIDGGTF